MKTYDIILVVLVLVIMLILVKKMSNYTAGSSVTDRQAQFISNPSGTWVDIDTTDTTSWTSTTLVPGGTSAGVNLNQVALANLNWLMWAGSNVLSSGQTITLPTGVTTNGVTGLRKKITQDANGNPVGTDVWFLTSSPTNKMTRTCQVGAVWDSQIPSIGRVSLPDYFILGKSNQDPRPPVDCSYTATSAGCDATLCGTSGHTKYTITNFSSALYGGACNSYHGAPISGNGTVTSTDTCNAPACAFVTTSGLQQFLGTPSPTPGSKATILSGAQALQTAEIDISTSPPAFNMPTGLMTSVTYTMSMDINIAQASIRWRSIFNSGNPDCCGPSTRHPAVYITGTQDAPPANRVRVVHAWDGNPDPGGPTTFAATPGTYFNLTWVVSGNALKTYINGSLDSTLVSASGTFNWNTPSNAWKWNSYLPDPSGANGNAAGPLKVKNVYWWNRALTAAEVATIGSSTTSTTSGYAVEPYTVSGLKTY